MDNVLDLFDQTVFLGERATGATNLLQCVWIYNRAIDIDGLRRARGGRRVKHHSHPVLHRPHLDPFCRRKSGRLTLVERRGG